jgi:RNA polymerase subunit RPABC4/transcription elongation factor Spt4
MNISENLNNSFEFAKKLTRDTGRLIVLIVLGLIPVANWIVVGYAARVLREAPAGQTPPKLENYGRLLVDGAKIFFASLVYMLIPTILIVVGAISALGGAFSSQEETVTSGIMLGGAGVALLLVGLILAFFFLIVLGVGIAHMVKTEKFGQAFAFGELISIIRGIGWAKYLGWVIVTSIIALLVGGVTGRIPFVGWLISAVVSPFLTVFIFRSLGDLYNDGAPPGLRTTSSVTGAIACAACGTTLQSHHKFCPTCGAPAPVTSKPTEAGESFKYCVSCGGKLPSSAMFCGSCGAKQTDVQ